MERTEASDFVPGYSSPHPRSGSALAFTFADRRMLVRREGERACVPRWSALSDAGLRTKRELYLGRLGTSHCYATELCGGERLPDDMSLDTIRSVMDMLPHPLAGLAGLASHLLTWDRTSQRCRRCGGTLEPKRDERAKQCLRCGLTDYPRISPAIIVAVVKAGCILLARSLRHEKGPYGLLAGFVNPGESLEECVRREVREEVGIEVSDIEYFGSQPWPFPDSLMIAFTARYAGGRLKIDGKELADAEWFPSGALPRIPTRATIARDLIDSLLERDPGPSDRHAARWTRAFAGDGRCRLCSGASISESTWRFTSDTGGRGRSNSKRGFH